MCMCVGGGGGQGWLSQVTRCQQWAFQVMCSRGRYLRSHVREGRYPRSHIREGRGWSVVEGLSLGVPAQLPMERMTGRCL